MKFLLVFVCLLVAVNALDKEFKEVFMAKMQEIGTQCIGETQASDDDVAKLISHQIPDTHEGQCMIFCLHKGFRIQKSDGSVDKEAAIYSLDPVKYNDKDLYEKLVKVFSICLDSVSEDSDPCVTATNLAKCGIEEGHKLGLKEDMFDV